MLKRNQAGQFMFLTTFTIPKANRLPGIDTGKRWAVHELGHAFESRVNGQTSWGYVRNSLTTDVSNRNGFAGTFSGWQQSEDYQNSEIFADMFIGWVYGRWAINEFTGALTTDALLKRILWI